MPFSASSLAGSGHGWRSGYRYLASAVCRLLAIAALLTVATPAQAHVGSPDVYAEGNAGPYRLFVTVRPPLVIPGVAEIEVRAEDKGPDAPAISQIEMAPIPLTGEAALHPPVADQMKQSTLDKQFFTGALWIMASGSWQVRFRVNGSQGNGVLPGDNSRQSYSDRRRAARGRCNRAAEPASA